MNCRGMYNTQHAAIDRCPKIPCSNNQVTTDTISFAKGQKHGQNHHQLNGSTNSHSMNVKTELSPLVIHKRRYKRKGNWGMDQQAKYYLFLTRCLKDFATSETRKLEKIFKRMSQYIGSRTSAQCRSHHQKHKNKNERWGDLLENLYLLAKDHPILQNQPIFSKMDPIYQQFFYLREQNSQKQTKQELFIVQPQKFVNANEIIFYEMPYFLQPITESHYFQLFQAPQMQQIDRQK